MKIEIFRDKIDWKEADIESPLKETDKELQNRVNNFCKRVNVKNIFQWDVGAIVVVYGERK